MIVNKCVPLSVFALIVTVFVTKSFPEPLKLTLISPFSPGAIGFSGFSGTVQPQLLDALVMISGASPVFLKVNTVSTAVPGFIFPKSCSISSNSITGKRFAS